MDKHQKIYKITELAEKLGISRQTVYYWINKKWIEPKRDYRNYPVFTEEEVKKIIKWKATIK